jgi:uncharacterized protein (DUF433 family)
MGDGAVSRIVQDPEILSGKPAVRGTRISVSVVLEYLADNPDFDELFVDYPRLTMDDVRACFAFAQTLVEKSPRKKVSAYLPNRAAESKESVVDAADLWERVRALEGQTLPTMSGTAEFDIAYVDDDKVRVLICSSGKPCSITRRRFEQAFALGLVVAGVTPNDLRQAGIENPTYAAAIIRAIVRQRPE